MPSVNTPITVATDFTIPVRNHRLGDERPRRELSPERRAYLREYYRRNKDRAREYQRQYSFKHRRKSCLPGCGGSTGKRRETIRGVFHMGDIMQATTEKSLRMIQLILSGERHFTM